jgi:hypothetical protein
MWVGACVSSFCDVANMISRPTRRTHWPPADQSPATPFIKLLPASKQFTTELRDNGRSGRRAFEYPKSMNIAFPFLFIMLRKLLPHEFYTLGTIAAKPS